VVAVVPGPVPWVRGVVLVVVEVAAVVGDVVVGGLVEVEVGTVLGTVVVGWPGLVVVSIGRVVLVVVVGGTVVVVVVVVEESTLVAPGMKKSPLGVCTTAPLAVLCGGLK
jgi:hypothetical protein